MSVSTSHLATDTTTPSDTIRLAGDGSGHAQFSDQHDLIEVNEDSVDDARRELLTLCVEVAQRRGAPIHVVADENGQISQLRVSPGGSITPVAGDAPGTAPAPRQRRSAARSVMNKAPSKVAPSPQRTAKQRTAKRWRMPSVSAPLLVVIAGLVVALMLALALFTLFGGGRVTDIRIKTQDVNFTATPPLEWSPAAQWRSPALAQDAGRALVIGGDKVALVTDKPRAVVLVEAATGKTLWSVEAPQEGLAGDLHATHIDGAVVVAVQAGNALHWWTLADGTPGKVDLPETARTTWEGYGPVIRESPGEAALVQGGELKRFAVPPAATFLAARKDGAVTAAAPQGWWHLTPGEQPAASPSAWEFGSTNPVQLQPVGYLSGRIITVLQPATEGQPARIVVQRDAEERVRFEFVGSINPPLAEINRGRAGDTATGNRFHAATSGTWGIFGRSLIDLTTSTITDLGAWQTVWIAADRAHGQINSQPVIAGPKIPPGVLQNGEAFPDDLTVAGALVRAKDGDDTYEYLLPPKTGQQ